MALQTFLVSMLCSATAGFLTSYIFWKIAKRKTLVPSVIYDRLQTLDDLPDFILNCPIKMLVGQIDNETYYVPCNLKEFEANPDKYYLIFIHNNVHNLLFSSSIIFKDISIKDVNWCFDSNILFIIPDSLQPKTLLLSTSLLRITYNLSKKNKICGYKINKRNS